MNTKTSTTILRIGSQSYQTDVIFPPCMLDPHYVQSSEHKRILDIEYPYIEEYAQFGMTLWEDLVYDEALKIERTVIRLGNVIPNSPSAQYNHDNPTDGLVYGDKVL